MKTRYSLFVLALGALAGFAPTQDRGESPRPQRPDSQRGREVRPIDEGMRDAIREAVREAVREVMDRRQGEGQRNDGDRRPGGQSDQGGGGDQDRRRGARQQRGRGARGGMLRPGRPMLRGAIRRGAMLRARFQRGPIGGRGMGQGEQGGWFQGRPDAPGSRPPQGDRPAPDRRADGDARGSGEGEVEQLRALRDRLRLRVEALRGAAPRRRAE